MDSRAPRSASKHASSLTTIASRARSYKVHPTASEGVMSERVLIDGFSRRVDYLRMSVTDRCDFRCVYCMAEDMQFLPRQRVLTLEEIYQLAQSFVALGTRKIRLT